MGNFIRDYEYEISDTLKIFDFDRIYENVVYEIFIEGQEHSMKLFHAFICGVSHISEELLIFISRLPHDFDIIVLTETFQIENVDMYHMRGRLFIIKR